MNALSINPSETMLSLRRIGNSQGVVLPKSLLEGLDFSHGITAHKIDGELRLRPAQVDDDPFGFGAAMLEMVASGSVDDLLIPDVFEDESFPE